MKSDRRHEGAFCQKLGLSAEALYRRAIAGDALCAFPDQPAGASPAGERVVDPALFGIGVTQPRAGLFSFLTKLI